MQNYKNDERDLDKLLELINQNNTNLMSTQIIKQRVEYIFNNFYIEIKNNKFDLNFINNIKMNIRNKDTCEKIIYMMIINRYLFGYVPRKIQIISLLFMIYHNNSNGLMEEVKTGEGKSLIIMFEATLKALEGEKIDILTSSPVLAERDSKMFKKFYETFGLTCDYCHEDGENNQNLNYKCYEADIVYGTVLSFAGDYLRTNFMGTKGRGYRKFDSIIIDEIDNICLDNIMNQTELLDNFKGYKLLEYIYLFIYHNLQIILSEFAKHNNNKFEISYFKRNQINIIKKLLETFNEFYNRNLITKEIKFPSHLYDFIQNRKKDWCNNAFDAVINYQINKHYLIAYDEKYGFDTIKPIDFSNTGVIQQDSVWSGLHQFLEIKHGLRLTEENLNSCFISNLCFFRLYKKRYGLTGTIGSSKTQETLKKIYNLDVIFIPTFRESKFKSGFCCIENQENFYINLLNEIYQKYNQGRAILVIMKYISQVNIIKQKLIETNININDIFIYDRDDDPNQSAFLKNKIGPKKIILSTNLSGRGTDIIINEECEKNGGLHVILTFKAESERIERQALGRAARKGEQGSGLIMLLGKITYEDLKKSRDEAENQKFDYLMNNFKKRTIFFQELFETFCNELNKLKNKNASKKQIMDIKEKWGLFLVDNNLDKMEEKEVLKDINESKFHSDNGTAILKAEIIKNGCEVNNNYNIIKKNFYKFIKEIFYNNNEYKYINPFIVILDFEEKNFELSQKMCDFSLGAIYMQIYKKITDSEKKIKITILKEIINKFNNLLSKVNALIEQYRIYEILINNIKYSDNRREILEQNQEKINYLLEFQKNLEKNKKTIECIKPNNNKKYIYTNEISLKLGEIKCKFQDIKQYFLDLGLFNTFIIEFNNDSCQLF